MAEQLNIIGSRCRFLAAKEMFYKDYDPSPDFRSGSGNLWCALTQTCIGPDGKLVEQHECGPGRSCFDSH